MGEMLSGSPLVPMIASSKKERNQAKSSEKGSVNDHMIMHVNVLIPSTMEYLHEVIVQAILLHAY